MTDRTRLAGGQILLGALCLAAVAALRPPAHAHAQAPQPLTVTALEAPAAVGSASPQLSTGGGRTILSWLERVGTSNALKFAERTADGWTRAQTVISGPQLLMNAADVPSVHSVAPNLFVAQWLQENGGDEEAYDLRVAWSADGRTWSAPISPHHDNTKTQHGFASIFPAAGGFGLIWLDGRAGADMALRATTFTAAGKQSAETVVDARVCECCQTSAAAVGDGAIAVFRNRDPNEIRDIYASRLTGGKWTAPAAVHNDGWRIEGCPVNGPSVSALGQSVAVAWFTVQNGAGHAYASFSPDGGRTFGKPLRVDDSSSAGRVQVALTGDGDAAVSWVEITDGRAAVKVRRINQSGSRSPPAVVAAALGRHYPRLAVHGNELLFAWVENTRGTTRVRTSRAPLPAR
jgi:hypothetical protein